MRTGIDGADALILDDNDLLIAWWQTPHIRGEKTAIL